MFDLIAAVMGYYEATYPASVTTIGHIIRLRDGWLIVVTCTHDADIVTRAAFVTAGKRVVWDMIASE